MNAAYRMHWADIDDAIDSQERIASPALAHSTADIEPWEESAIETLDTLTTIDRIDRRPQFADRFYTP